MNRIYNSIWNEVTQAFVAVGEHVSGRGKRSSSSSRREALAEGPRQILHARPQMMALEARLMFDGAAVSHVLELPSDAPVQPQAEPPEHGQPAPVQTSNPRAYEQPEVGPTRSAQVELVFIESNVAAYQEFLNGLRPGIEVHVLDASSDGLEQIAAIVQGRSGIDTLHIVSHGAKGVMGLGSVTLNSDTLSAHADKLAAIGASLSDSGDLLLYGCNIAAGAEGQAFVQAMAQATGADVAASSDATGAAAKGGDWILESKTGSVDESRVIEDTSYSYILPAPLVITPGSGLTATFTRPGGISDTWSFGTSTVNGVSGLTTTNIQYYEVPAFSWFLTRGSFQYSSNGGANWNAYTLGTPTAVAGTTWRFVDALGGNTTTIDNVGISWQVAEVPNSSTSTGTQVGPDNPATDIACSRNYVLSDATQSLPVATLTPADTGYVQGGHWSIDSQSVANLFTVSATGGFTNTATLSMGTGVLPAIGQTASVTLRYHDFYQTDSSGNPINGQGFTKTLTYTVVSATSQDLNFGDDLDVSSTTTRDQTNASVTTLSNGNFVSVWQSDGQGGEAAGKNGIYARIYDAMGAPLSAEFAITTAGNGVDEITPVVTALNGGRFAVAYTTTGTGRDIGYRIVEANGTVGSQLIANTATAGDQAAPTMSTLSDGSFVIAWTTAAGVQAQKFNAADGSKNGVELSLDASGGNVNPSLAALSNGSYVLAWGDSNSYNIKAVVSSAPSTVIDVTSDGLASSDVANSGLPAAKVVGLSGGGFVVAWSAYDAGYAQCDIYFQRYNNAGVAQGSITQANTSGATGTYKDAATIAALSGGGFVIGWQADTGDYDESGLFGRRFSATGVAVDGSDFEINQYRRGHQNTVALTGVGSDRFAAVWTDNSSDGASNKGVEGRVLLPPNAAPIFVGATTTLSANENSSAIDIKNLLHVSDSDSGQTLTWSQSSAPSHGSLSFSAATASSGGGDITPGGTITYTPTAGYTGGDSFTVQVSDGSGGTVTRTITVTVNDVDPVLGNATMSVNENVAGGSAVGTISATGDTNGLTYAITGGSGQGLFTINSSTGAISVAAGADLDYEAASSLTLTVTVDDEDVGSTADATATVTVNLNNLAEPADQNFDASNNIGNSSTSRTIGNLVFSSNGGAQVDIVDDVNGYFSETFTNFTGRAIINDYTGSASGSITYFQFSSLGLADDFRLISLAANALDNIGGFPSNFTITGYQGGSSGTVVTQVTGFNFALGATYGAGNSAIVYSKDSAVYNGGNLSFGSAWNNIDTVRFTATAGGGVGLALDTINLSAATPPNLAPSFVGATTTLTVDENSGAADIKSLLHASDADSGQTLTWSQSAAPSHGTLSFSAATASSGGGDITPGGTITYTPTAGYSGSDSFTVQVSDGNGGTATRTITVTTTDINPVIGNASVGLAENSGNGTAVTTVTASNDTNGLNYAITGGNTGGAFAINASTGAITVANAAALDYESNPNFSLTVTVDDEDGDSTADSTATITINLSNVNEAPVNTVPGAQTFNEDSVRVFSAGNGNALSVGDVDAGSILTTVLSVGAGKGSLSVTLGGGASISGDGTNSVQIVGTAAQVQAALASVSYTPTANAFGAGYATLTISSSDNGAGTLNDSDTVTFNLNAVADTPSVTGAATTPATQSSSGLVFSRNAADGAEVSHFKITGISNGTLYLNDGTTVVSEGSFITFAQGSAGLKFTPSGASDGSFNAQASLSNNDGGLGGALVQALISTGIAVASTTINEDSDSGAITISGTDAFYKLSAISGGTLYSDAGYTSVLAEGSFIASAGISTSVYFRPTANFNGNAGFSVRGSSSNNDGGLAGSTVNSLITVTAVNDAPTLGGGNHVFTGTNEDTASAGALVSDMLTSGGWADVDSGALAGLALTASSGNGSWQYSTDGTNWAAVGAVSGNSALLLNASSRLRYLPDGLNGETATLSYRAWDQSSGTASTFGSAQKVSTASNGGGSAFSSVNGSASIVVSAVNDAPSLGAVTPASYVDTSAADNFSANSGNLAGTDVDAGASLAYGITGGTVAGGFSTRVGSYGTLSVNTSTGAYSYTPNAAAINGLSANGSESFTVSVSDGISSATASYTVNFTGANDAPLLPTPAAASLVDTAANDSFASVSGSLGGSDAEGSALSYAISGGTLAGGFSSKAGSYGTLSVNASTGAFVFTPNSDAINALSSNTSETFTINLSDGNSSVNTTYTVNLTAANDTPVLTAPAPISYTDTEANDSFASASGNLAGSDREVGSTLTFGVSGGTVAGGFSTLVGVHGSLAVNTTTGAYVFTPNAAAINALVASTSETFTLTLSDGSATGTASYVVNLIKANQTPQLSPVSVSYLDTAGADVFSVSTGNLAGSDPDAGSTLSYAINGGSSSGGFSVRQGLYGSLSINIATGAYSYTPNDAAINALAGNTSESFTVSISDGQLSSSASFTVNVTASNDAPQLQAPAALQLQDTPANDSFAQSSGSFSASDAEGSNLSYGLQGGAVAGGFSTLVGTYGTLSINTSTGAYNYTPNTAAINGLSANGSDNFTVTVSDGISSATASYTVNFTGANDAPLMPTPAAANLVDTTANDSFANVSGSLGGSDAEGAALSYAISGGTLAGGISSKTGSYGTLSVNANTGAFVFTPNSAAINALSSNTSETFTINLSDGTSSVNSTYTVNLTAANDTPVLTTPAPISYTDTEANDSFARASGSLAGSDPDTGSTLIFGVSGGTVADGFSTRVGSYGTLSVNIVTGAYSYTPNDAAINALAGNSSESFTVSVSDGNGDSSSVSVNVQLSGRNDVPQLPPPQAAQYSDRMTPQELLPTRGSLQGSDGDAGSSLSFSITGGVTTDGISRLQGRYGSLSLNTATGAYVYTPDAQAIASLGVDASESFSLQVTDGSALSNAVFRVDISASNNAPVISAPADLIFKDTAATDSIGEIQGRLAVSDAEGGSLSYGLVGGTTAGGFSTLRGRFGSLVLNNSDGSYRYIPDSAAINALAGPAEESFELSVSDGGNSSSTKLRVRLEGSNDAPQLQAPPVLRLVDGPGRDSFGPMTGTLLASDAEGATLSYSLDGGTVQGELSSLSGPLGSLVLNSRTGAYTFTPNEAAINGLAELASVSFGISVSDGQNRSSQQLQIRAEGSNDAPRVGSLPANVEIRQDQTLALTLPADAFSDPDSTAPLSLRLSLADGSPLPAWLRFDPATRNLSGTPGAADSGLLRLRLTASDSSGATASSEFQITVTVVAPPPPVPESQPAPPPPAPPAPVPAPAPAPVPTPSLPPAVDTGLTQDTRPGAPNLPSPLQPLLPVQPLPVDLAPAPAPAALAPVPAPAPAPAPAPLAAPTPTPAAGPAPAPAPTATAAPQPSGPVTAAPARDTVATGTPSSAAPVLTSSGGGGGAFQIAVTQADQPALVLFKGVPDQTISRGGSLSFAIPADAFAHTDAGAVVQLAASQVNGQPLPAWLSFNASNGSFNGTPPLGLLGDLSVRVVARDQEGREVVAIFRITVSVNTGAASSSRSLQATELNDTELPAEPEALPTETPMFEFDGSEPNQKGQLPDSQLKPLAQLKPSGRASFSEQIRMAGRGQALERPAAAPPRSAA